MTFIFFLTKGEGTTILIPHVFSVVMGIGSLSVIFGVSVKFCEIPGLESIRCVTECPEQEGMTRIIQ